jgi:opacity protein-like surface antigen
VKQLGWFATARILATAYGTDRDFIGRFATIRDVRTDWSASLGLSVEGASRVQIGLTYEYLADPETKPFPAPQHFLTLGFTFSSVQGLW